MSYSYLDVEGRRIAWRGFGPAGGRPVLLLHALASSSASWDTVAAELATRGRRTIAVDLRGHGRSSAATGYAMEDFWPELVALLDHLGCERADVIGHSLGGQVALRLAARRPERVGRLILEEPALPREDGEPAGVAPGSGWRRLAKLLGVARLARVLLFNRFDRRVLRPVLGYVRGTDPGFPALLAAVRKPTLVLAAHADGGTCRYRRLASILGTAQFEALGNSHHLHREHPQRFVEHVEAFLSSPTDIVARGLHPNDPAEAG